MERDESKLDTKTARLFDKRTVERSIKKGLVARKDYEKYVKSLEDVSDKGVSGVPEADESAPAAAAQTPAPAPEMPSAREPPRRQAGGPARGPPGEPNLIPD